MMLAHIPRWRTRYRVVGFDQRGTGGSGLLRCRELETRPTAAQRARRSSVRAAGSARPGASTRRRTPSRTSRRSAPTLGVEQADAVRHLLRDRAGARLRPRAPRPRRSPDHRLRGRPRRPRPVRPGRLPRDAGRACAGLCPARCRGVSARAGDAGGEAGRTAAHARPARDLLRPPRAPPRAADRADRDRRPAVRLRLQPAAARGRARRREGRAARRRGAARAPGGRGRRAGGAAGSPKSFSSARYATVCEETPLPWDASHAARRPPRGGPAARERRSARPRSSRSISRPPRADEIGLCLRWPGVPSGPGAGPRAPYPAVPTLMLQGGEDLRTPPEGSARVASRDPGRAARGRAGRRPRGGRRRPERLRRAGARALRRRQGRGRGLPPRRHGRARHAAAAADAAQRRPAAPAGAGAWAARRPRSA